MSSLSPWKDNYGDPAFELSVPTAGDDGQVSLDVVPAPGQTQLVGATGTFSDFVGGIAVYNGDVGYLNELANVTVSALVADGGILPVAGSTVIASGVTSPSGPVDGGAMSVTATLSPATAGTLNIDWQRSLYAALRYEFGSNATVAYTTFGLSPVPYGFYDNGWPGYSGTLLNLYPDDSSMDDLNAMNISYGNPYSAIWGVAGGITVGYQRTFSAAAVAGASIDGGTPPMFHSNVFFTQYDRLQDLATSALGMRITPPTDVRVNGLPADGSQSITGTNLIVDWDPPAVGTANGYRVSLREILADTSRGYVRYQTLRVASFSLPGDSSQLVVPPGLVATGHTYQFVITALAVNSTHFDTEPRIANDRLPQADAPIATGLVTLQ